MTHRVARFLTSLYPRCWRERYEEEFLQFLQEHPLSVYAVLNVIVGAFYQRLRALGDRRDTIFSNYTEGARRAIFFARYEASHFGSESIEAEHLLLGILRENGKVVSRFLDASAAHAISENAKARLIVREKKSFSIDLPLSPECKRILAYTQQEAEHLNHTVGAVHFLLGILREEESKAAEILRSHGLQLSVMREKLIQSSLRKRH